VKLAYVDITLEALGDHLHLWVGPENLLKGIAHSPLGGDHVRLLLSGNSLPDRFTEEPRRARLVYEGCLTGKKVTIYDCEVHGHPDPYN
jgi:hypothetical protein